MTDHWFVRTTPDTLTTCPLYSTTMDYASGRVVYRQGGRDLLGEGYVEQMRPSPLITRLMRMRDEIERGQESFERKLRYLLWLN